MALAEMLSALRTIILDVPELPASQSERVKSFRGLFPALSNEEIEDLSHLPPERLQIYTRSIFSGERSLLLNNFKLTFAFMSREAAGGAALFASAELAREVHRQFPWKTSTTPGLIESFMNFLTGYPFSSIEERETALDIATFEKSLFFIRRSEANLTPAGPTKSDLSERTVGEILEIPLSLPANSMVQKSSCDLAALSQSFTTHNGRLPEDVVRRPCWFALGRDHQHRTRWLEIPESVFHFLSENFARTATLGDLAGAFVESLDSGIPEKRAFGLFLDFACALAECGAISLKNHSP
jgi:hypothetical protein